MAGVDTPRWRMNTPLADNIVSVFSTRMAQLGNYRYLLFDISATENDDPFGNTFYSEIDVVPSGIAAAGVRLRSSR